MSAGGISHPPKEATSQDWPHPYHESAAKRIDTAATALWNHMTVEQMTALDLAYAPPFSPVWDPILVAARQASAAVRAAP